MPTPGQHYTLAKATAGSIKMPDAAAIGKAFSVATTLEAANYLCERFEKAAAAANVTKEYQAVLDEMKKYDTLIYDQTPVGSKYWSGDQKAAILSKFRTFQASLAKAAADSLVESIPEGKEIDFIYDMNDKSELLQGYLIDGQPIQKDENDEEGKAKTEQINNIYSDWLTENRMICSDGVIYKCDGNGEIIEENGQPLKVSPTEYKELFEGKTAKTDEKLGFSKFVTQKTGGKLVINVMTQEDLIKKATEAEAASRSKG
jgi:hypothetical protein